MNARDSESRYDEILNARAAQLARSPEEGTEREVVATVAVVAIGLERIGIPVEGLREIIRVPPVARLPGLPVWLTGVVQIRGELICLLDMARWLGIPSDGEAAFLAVVEGAEGALGLMVDAVLGFKEICSNDIAATFGAGTVDGSRPMRATTKDLVSLIDVDRLLSGTDIVVERGSGVRGGPDPRMPKTGTLEHGHPERSKTR